MTQVVKDAKAPSLTANLPDVSKFLTREHVISAVIVLIGIIIAVLFARAQIYVGSVLALIISGAVTYAMNRALPAEAPATPAETSTPAKRPKTRSKDKDGTKVYVNSVVLNTIVVGVCLSILISAVIPLVYSILIVAISASWVLLAYWKNEKSWKAVRQSFTMVMLPIGTLKWFPLSVHLEGSWAKFFFGWFPLFRWLDAWIHLFDENPAYLVPKVRLPLSKNWHLLTIFKIELVDIMTVVLCAWSFYTALSQPILSLMGFPLSVTEICLALTFLVLCNEDGSKWRIFLYLAICHFGIMAESAHVVVLAPKMGLLPVGSIAVQGAGGATLQVLTAVAVSWEVVLQPVWNLLMASTTSPVAQLRATLTMSKVSDTTVLTSTQTSDGSVPAQRTPAAVVGTHYKPDLSAASRQEQEVPKVIDTRPVASNQSVVPADSKAAVRTVERVAEQPEAVTKEAPKQASAPPAPAVVGKAVGGSGSVDSGSLLATRTASRVAPVIVVENGDHKVWLQTVQQGVGDLATQNLTYVAAQIRYLADKFGFENEVDFLEASAKAMADQKKSFKTFRDFQSWVDEDSENWSE